MLSHLDITNVISFRYHKRQGNLQPPSGAWQTTTERPPDYTIFEMSFGIPRCSYYHGIAI